MSNEGDGQGGRPSDGEPASDTQAEDRAAILRRRNRFIAAAFAGVAASAGAACGDDGPMACLSIAADASTQDADADADGGPTPCLSVGEPDAGMDAEAEAEDDAGDSSDAGRDGGPMPCLSPLPPDSGMDAEPEDDAGPMPCLSLAPPDGGD